MAYTKDLTQLRKLDDRSHPGIFIGYANGTKAYRVFDPATQRVRVPHDVVFDEPRMGLGQGRRGLCSDERRILRRAHLGSESRGCARHVFIDFIDHSYSELPYSRLRRITNIIIASSKGARW
jgi:hypothetical protein